MSSWHEETGVYQARVLAEIDAADDELRDEIYFTDAVCLRGVRHVVLMAGENEVAIARLSSPHADAHLVLDDAYRFVANVVLDGASEQHAEELRGRGYDVDVLEGVGLFVSAIAREEEPFLVALEAAIPFDATIDDYGLAAG